jgi:hypothetical protein
MDDKQRQLSDPVGRNDLCPCGSGKKYKRCCMPKDEEQEQLRRDLENLNDVTDHYFPVKEYIDQSGYPLTMFDYFLLEILNVAGGVLDVYGKLTAGQNREALQLLLREAKEFYANCQHCENACLANPLKTVSFEPLLKYGLPLEKYPSNLQQPLSVNLFYIELMEVMSENLYGELKKIIPSAEAGQIAGAVHHALLEFISVNCWDSCAVKCQKEHDKNAYCKFCLFGDQELPCPKKEEISFEEIMVKEEDLLH